MDINQLRDQILEKRSCGVVHVLLFERLPDLSWEESVIAKSQEIPFFSWESVYTYRENGLGLLEQPVSVQEARPLFDELPDRQAATAVIAYLLCQDMAYGAELMSLQEANELANNFIALFSEKAHYHSNSSWNTEERAKDSDVFKPRLRGWNGLTDATFDSGIIAVDSDKIGIVWFEDED